MNIKLKFKTILLFLFIFLIYIIFNVKFYRSSSITTNKTIENDKDIVILFTNNINCNIDNYIGFAGLSEYKKRLNNNSNKYIALVDAGNFSQGTPFGSIKKGKYILDIMNKVGYDVIVPGSKEFEYGINEFLTVNNNSQNLFCISNLINKNTSNPLLDRFKLFTYGNKKIAFIGVSEPPLSKLVYNNNKITDSIFLDEDMDNKLLNNIQNTVDIAKSQGADYIILISNLTENNLNKIINNTYKIDYVISSYSKNKLYETIITNKKGKKIPVAQSDENLKSIGELTIKKNGNLNLRIITNVPQIATNGEILKNENGDYLLSKDSQINQYITQLKKQYENDIKNEIILENNNVELITTDLTTGKNIIKTNQTNFGDLCADAYRYIFDTDIGLVLSSNIKKSLHKGTITYSDCLSTIPFNNKSIIFKCSGQTIKDLIEMSTMKLPDENDLFLQVSGITYEVNTNEPSNIILDKSNKFVEVNEKYRINNIKINSEDLDLEKYYLVATSEDIINNKQYGFTMLDNVEIIKDNLIIDIDVITNYLKINGTDNYQNNSNRVVFNEIQ